MKPVVLYVGNPIRSHTQRWAELSARLQVLYYRPLALPELAAAAGRASDPASAALAAAGRLGEPRLRRRGHGRPGRARDLVLQRGGRGQRLDGRPGAVPAAGVLPADELLRAHGALLRRGNFYDIEGAVAATAQNPRGRLLGIVGLGEIGQAVAERAQRALGMAIHYFGRRRKSAAVEQRLGGAVYHARLESLLAVADCVVLACPHTEETHHLLNARTFALMKKGVRVVNVGRGKCVDEEALADALEAGIVSAAGLDVYEEEPRINERLLDSWQVTLMPHIGGATVDTQANFERIAMDNLESFFFGDGKPVTPVNVLIDN
ncbi:2-hydroxyacid dehydrogenase [Trichophyton tonsurans CBS 112818]|uniref:2-hydroxyacid dehydrogenase n=1 Tax=Trichophyton tonsurans (strain CBS 112818) TaxID=647933 RepID=F2RP89_TRIT1|nr:2-hydroxyacid dehydrogenase [Trichophyton tonsurans CBS 112818]